MRTATGIKYRKDFVKELLRYPVLVVSQLPKEQVEALRAIVKPIVTGIEAAQFIHLQVGDKKAHELGWSYQWLNEAMTLGILRNRGIDVALFYKRQTAMVEPEVGQPFPVGWIKEPTDAWQRLDILGPSARQANVVLHNQYKRYADEIALLKQQLEARTVLADTSESAMNKTILANQDLVRQKDKLLERLAVLSQHVSGKKIRAWMEAHQKEKDRHAKRKLRVAKRIAAAMKDAAKYAKASTRKNRVFDKYRHG